MKKDSSFSYTAGKKQTGQFKEEFKKEAMFGKNYAALKKQKKGNILQRHLQSQKYAWLGLFSIFKEEPNFRIELAIAVIVIILGLIFQLSAIKMVLLFLTISMVLISEMVNSVVERLCDIYTLEQDISVKFIKDVGAGGVLLTSILAIIIGLIIFVPDIIALIF